MSKLEKRFGKTLFDKPRTFIHTGNLALDYIISLRYDGSGGIPVGWIAELAGKSQTGKTLIASKIASEFQKRDGFVFFGDVERAYEFENMEHIGMDHTPIAEGGSFYYDEYDTIEDFYENSVDFANMVHEEHPEAPICLVLDSLGMIKTAEEMEKGIDYEDMGRRAKKNKEMMRLMLPVLNNCNATLLIINHVYVNLSPMGPRVETGGGMASDYSPHLRIMFLTTKLYPNDKEPEGARLRAKIVKNRYNYRAMGKICEFDISFDEGPLKYSGVLPLMLSEVDGLSQSKGWFDYKGHKFRASDFAGDPEYFFEMFKKGGRDANRTEDSNGSEEVV